MRGPLLVLGELFIGRAGDETVSALTPTVSVVIPTYNRPELLRRAVASACVQERVLCEVIVVDDRSTPAVATGDLPEDVTVLRTGRDGGGVSAARNLGVEIAQGSWIAFLDDDDWWSPEHLHGLLTAARAAGADVAYAATWNVELASGRAMIRPAPPPDELVTRLLRENAIGTPSCLMVSRPLHLAVGGFDTSLSAMADWDLWLRLAEAGAIAANPVATVAYATHADNMSLDPIGLIDEFRRLSERYAPLCQREGIRFGHPGFPRWIAGLYRRQGRRGAAAAWYLRSARVPGQRRDLVRAGSILLGEPAMRAGALFLGERAKLMGSHPSQLTQSGPLAWLSPSEIPLRAPARGRPFGKRP